jgi:HAD superfamily hydrolase (TIGR01509 family)
MLHSIKGVIWDMDGLILDTERVSWAAWQLAARKLNVEFSFKEYAQLVGRTMTDARAFLCRHFGASFPVGDFMQVASAYYLSELEKGVPVKEGVSALLGLLADLKIPSVVATSTHHEWAIKKLKKAGLLDCFIGVIGGDQVTCGKPQPDIFIKAAQLLELPVEVCLVLEDSPMGILGAAAAGTTPIWIPDLIEANGEALDVAAAVFPSLTSFCQHWNSSRIRI